MFVPYLNRQHPQASYCHQDSWSLLKFWWDESQHQGRRQDPYQNHGWCHCTMKLKLCLESRIDFVELYLIQEVFESLLQSFEWFNRLINFWKLHVCVFNLKNNSSFLSSNCFRKAVFIFWDNHTTFSKKM